MTGVWMPNTETTADHGRASFAASGHRIHLCYICTKAEGFGAKARGTGSSSRTSSSPRELEYPLTRGVSPNRGRGEGGWGGMRPFSFFTDFWVWVTSEARGSDSVGFWGSCQLSPFFWGGGPAGGLYRPSPPPETKTCPERPNNPDGAAPVPLPHTSKTNAFCSTEHTSEAPTVVRWMWWGHPDPPLPYSCPPRLQTLALAPVPPPPPPPDWPVADSRS